MSESKGFSKWVTVACKQANGGRGSGCKPSQVSVCRIREKGILNHEQFAMTIGSDLLKELRWIDGDLVEIVECDGMFGVRRGKKGWVVRVNSGGSARFRGTSDIAPQMAGQEQRIFDAFIDGDVLVVGELLPVAQPTLINAKVKR